MEPYNPVVTVSEDEITINLKEVKQQFQNEIERVEKQRDSFNKEAYEFRGLYNKLLASHDDLLEALKSCASWLYASMNQNIEYQILKEKYEDAMEAIANAERSN